MRKHAVPAVIAAIALTYGLLAAGGQSSNAPALRRTANGHPDLSGVWQAMNSAAWNIQGHHAQQDVPAGLGVVEGDDIPYQPWAAEKQKQNYDNRMVIAKQTIIIAIIENRNTRPAKSGPP